MKRNLRKHIIIIVFACVINFVIAYSYSVYLGNQKKESIKGDLKILVETISSFIDHDRFKSIKSSPEDNKNPDYQYIREKMIEAGKVNKDKGVRWIYTVVPQDGKVVFSIDSITDSNHSEPGDIYNDVEDKFAEAVKNIWNGDGIFFVGPYTDQWGKFFSVLAPIKDSQGKTVSVLVADIDYYFYKTTVDDVKRPPIIVSIISIIIFILTYLFILYILNARRKASIEVSRMKYALEGIGDGMWDWDLVNDEMFFSKKYKEMLGFSESEIQNTRSEWKRLIHPEDFKNTNSMLNDYINGISDHYQSIHRVLCKNGDYKWILDRGKITSYDKNGKPERIVGTHSDLTSFKNIENQLQKKVEDYEEARGATMNVLEDISEEKKKVSLEKERISAILENIVDGVVVLGNDLKINMINKAALNLIYKKSIDVTGSKCDEVFKFNSESDHQKSVDLLQGVIRNNSTQSTQGSISLKNKNKENIQVICVASPILDANGKLVNIAVIIRDITKEYQIDKAKTEFVSLASHQLKTPVGAINWNTEMLLDGDYGKLNDQQREVIEEIFVMNKRMSSLVADFLNISRIELGTFMIEPEKVSYPEVCEEILIELKSKIQEKNHTIIKNYQTDMPETVADPKLLAVVFQNLLSNAVKYTDDNGKIEISIGIEKKNILISVKNNGRPIPIKDQPKIFERLFRAADAQDMDPNGNGLGLYLVKNIVESAGGKIWFTSKENEGTAFYISFPLPGMVRKEGTKKIT